MHTCLTNPFRKSSKRNHPKFALLAVGIVSLAALVAAPQARAQAFTGTYTFGTAGNVTSFDYNGTDVLNLTEGPLTKDGVTSSSSSGNFRANQWSTDGFDSNKFFAFTLTAGTGFTVDMTSITFGIGRSGTGTRNSQWRSSVDDYANTISTYTTVNAGLTNTSGVLNNPDSNSSWTGNILDLSGTAFDSLSTVTFRFYMYDAESTAGTAGFQGPLSFAGTLVSAGPPPAGNFWVGDNAVLGGNGTWEASGGTSWRTDNTDGTGGNFTATELANFGGATAGTVTVSSTVAPTKGITFATDGYNVTGGTISLAGATLDDNTITTATSVAATIASDLTGSDGLTKAGAGTLVFTGAKTYTGGTTLSAGTLQLGDGTTNGSIAGDVTNDATLAFNNGSAQTFAGNITGSGALTKTGAGNVTLTGTNSYSGGTTVTTGTLTGTTNSLQGAIANDAAVTFDQGTAGTYAGDMTGSGSLTKQGVGNVTLSGTNSYAGGTTVSAGTLTGTTGSLQGAIANNAAVVFDQGTAGTYAGNMDGSGSLTMQGAGDVTLSGTNSYSGGTTVSAGTLTGTTSSLQGAIANNAAVVFDQGSTGTYAGNMTGSGSLTKTGVGELTLSGSSSFNGGTSIDAGTVRAASNTALGSGGVAVGGNSTLLVGSGINIANAVTVGLDTGVFYSQDFDGIGAGLPLDWTVRTDASASALGSDGTYTATATGWADTGGSFKNFASATGLTDSSTVAEQEASDDRALGIRQTGAFGDPGASFNYAFSTTGETITSISLDLMMLSVQTRSTTWSVEYGIGANPTSFSSLGSYSDPGTWGTTPLTITDATFGTALNDQANVVFRVAALSDTTGSGSRDSFGLDNFVISSGNIITPGAVLGSDISSGTATFSGGVTLNGTAQLTAATGGTTAFTGVVSGVGGVEKIGVGEVELSGTNTYIGTTTVTEGTLIAANASALGSGTVSVEGGTLATTVVNVDIGNFNMTSGDFSLNGAATGTLTLSTGSDLVWTGGVWNLSMSVASFDSIIGVGAGSVFAISNTTLALSGSVALGTYNILTGFTSGSGTMFSAITGLGAGQSASTMITGGVLALTVIPEPHEYALMLAGLLGLVIVLRRVRSTRIEA